MGQQRKPRQLARQRPRQRKKPVRMNVPPIQPPRGSLGTTPAEAPDSKSAAAGYDRD
jgi:hypothetical protein